MTIRNEVGIDHHVPRISSMALPAKSTSVMMKIGRSIFCAALPAPGESAFDEDTIDLGAALPEVEPPPAQAAAGYADEFFDLSTEPIIAPDEPGGER